MFMKGLREGFFGALSYGALFVALVPFTAALLFIWAAIGGERFRRNLDALTKALEDAKRSLNAARI
jgi:hypothetical protein